MRQAKGERKPRTLSWREKGVAIGLVLIPTLEHLAFGGGRDVLGLTFAFCHALVLILALSFLRTRNALGGLRLLWPTAIAFSLTIALALWALTPFQLAGVHPIWSYVDAQPAAALDKSAVLIEVVKLLGLACLFLLARLVGASDERSRLALKSLVLLTTVFAAWSFLAHVTGLGMGFNKEGPRPARLLASFGSPNTAAAVFGSAFILAVAWVADRSRSLRDADPGRVFEALYAPVACAVVLLTSLVLTASRMGTTATAIALVLLLGWVGLTSGLRSSRWIGLFAAGVLALGAALAVASSDVLWMRATERAVTADARHRMFAAHWDAFLASPWGGYGLGAFDRINQLYLTGANYGALRDVYATHNVYLQWLEEAGLPGALAMFATIAILLFAIIKGAVRRQKMGAWLKGLAAMSVVFLVHGTTDYALQLPSVQAFWAVALGLGASVAARRS